MLSPSDEYSQRLRARQEQAARFTKLSERIANVRLALGVIIILGVSFSLLRDAFPLVWLSLPIVVFAGVVWYHAIVRRALIGAHRAAAVYRNGLSRLEDCWSGQGQQGERFQNPNHVYAADLDLFGPGGLFELLCTARTRMGEEALAQWLLAPASSAEIQQRHAAIAELRALIDFREELAVSGEEPTVGVQPNALLIWAEAPGRLKGRWIRWSASLLAVLALNTAIVWYAFGIASPFLAVLLLEAAVIFALKDQLKETMHATESAFDNLTLLSDLLTRFERESFRASRLQGLIQALQSHNLSASLAIAHLRKIVQFIESRRNPFVGLLDVPLMYSVHVATVAEVWRRQHGHVVRSWLNSLGELEALVSLATYSYEHPLDPFPEFVPGGAASFNGEGLCHPLIPKSKAVCNDVTISGELRMLLVSGSNMSGKSTLLRTVGINTVLAMAGAPVRAARLQLTELQVGASIRVNDSLHQGNSRFYAEITRLRQLHELAGQCPPLLFLLDELLQGTNSADRRVGAEGTVRALLDRGAIGLISTHDLALTSIAGPGDQRLKNVHFQDDLKDGRMTFDFKLHEGMVTKSNALELMRAIGLNV